MTELLCIDEICVFFLYNVYVGVKSMRQRDTEGYCWCLECVLLDDTQCTTERGVNQNVVVASKMAFPAKEEKTLLTRAAALKKSKQVVRFVVYSGFLVQWQRAER
jgi:hypothetical protein